MMLKNKQWWKSAGIRAIKTFFQTVVAMVPTTAVIAEVQWFTVVETALLAAVLSLCTSLGGLPEVEK